MQGQQVTRNAGWDTHGLPVEIEVEKELKLSGKQDIERFGVAEFNARAARACSSTRATGRTLTERIGYWLDYEHPYVTFSNDYIESVWWVLRRLHERELLYRGHQILPYCPRCGTVLSSHEVALGYEDVTTNSVYVTFPLGRRSRRASCSSGPRRRGRSCRNVALAVHPDLEYGEYQVGDRAPDPGHGARRGCPSSCAKGAPTFAELGARAHVPGTRAGRARGIGGRSRWCRCPTTGRRGVVVLGDFVTADDGSGVVHMAPAFGADDYQAGIEHGLAFVQPVAARRQVPRRRPGPRSRAGWSRRARPTISSSSGSSRTAAGI